MALCNFCDTFRNLLLLNLVFIVVGSDLVINKEISDLSSLVFLFEERPLRQHSIFLIWVTVLLFSEIISVRQQSILWAEKQLLLSPPSSDTVRLLPVPINLSSSLCGVYLVVFSSLLRCLKTRCASYPIIQHRHTQNSAGFLSGIFMATAKISDKRIEE